MINHYAIIRAPGTAAYIFDANSGAYLAKIVNPGAHNFAFAGGNGQNGGMVTIGETLALTSYLNTVGDQSSAGTVYTFTVPEPATAVLTLFAGAALLARAWATNIGKTIAGHGGQNRQAKFSQSRRDRASVHGAS